MYLQTVPHNEPINATVLENHPAYALNESGDNDESEDLDESEDGDEGEDGDVIEDDDENEDENEEESQQELPCIEENHAPNIEYDPLDPSMKISSTYANMKVFKFAMSQHAIKHQFEFNIVKSGPKRFKAYCSRKFVDKYPWWIYATTTADGCTMKVKKNPCDHDCFSTRRKKKIKNATKHWKCENVKYFLIAYATLEAKDLQKKLKEHHKVHIHYKRVYMGKELALRQLYGDWYSNFDNLYRFKELRVAVLGA